MRSIVIGLCALVVLSILGPAVAKATPLGALVVLAAAFVFFAAWLARGKRKFEEEQKKQEAKEKHR